MADLELKFSFICHQGQTVQSLQSSDCHCVFYYTMCCITMHLTQQGNSGPLTADEQKDLENVGKWQSINRMMSQDLCARTVPLGLWQRARLWLSCLQAVLASVAELSSSTTRSEATVAFVCCLLLMRTNWTRLALAPTNLWLQANWLTSLNLIFIKLDFSSSYFIELLELRSFLKWYK